MNRRYMAPLASFIIVGGLALSVGLVEQNAMALPMYTSACGGCHTADGTVTMKVTKVSETASTITYSVTGLSAYNKAQGWAVFSTSNEVSGGYSSASNQFTVDKGATYTVYWVDKDPNSMKGCATQTLAVPAATTTTTQATTTTQPTTTTQATTTTTCPTTTTTRQGTTTTRPVTSTTQGTATQGTTTTTPVVADGDDGEFDHHFGDSRELDGWHRFLEGNRLLVSRVGTWFARIL